VTCFHDSTRVEEVEGVEEVEEVERKDKVSFACHDHNADWHLTRDNRPMATEK
jgi:hypothetical protein